MRNYKIMAAALMMATMMAGCSQDEGNYDYHSLNEPTITGVPETISVLTHANIDLDPNLGDNITDLDAYNYEWKVINKSGDNEVTVLGNEKTSRAGNDASCRRIYPLLHGNREEDRTLLAAELYTHRERYLFRRLDGAL